ncbi:glutathione S-transferase family protein [Lacimicrobium sp. SS2-24]|uniref:glutathione S-transferase family protein n=1 Tax=Lacimicrobium sp. SS2-24 TaxID=2005569 RepID=UPI000B4B2A69|nr:glutathione S-transferase family protein [Lacimicrobium sp. SS2-24]
MKIYGDSQSGNCYKIQLLCSLLDIEHQWIAVNILAGDTGKADFLEKNPNGKIPLLELVDGRYVSESNAILNYLAYGSELLPTEPFLLAKVQQWQFFEQYSHEPYIAVARFIARYLGLPEERKEEYRAKQAGGHKALAVMEQQLSTTPYLTGNDLTTADISLYGYTHVAQEGGFELQRYPAIGDWLQRISALPGYIDMGTD